jgi:hypothetical protein
MEDQRPELTYIDGGCLNQLDLLTGSTGVWALLYEEYLEDHAPATSNEKPPRRDPDDEEDNNDHVRRGQSRRENRSID